MKEPMHKELASGRWAEMSLAEQLANIGSEVYRISIALQAGKKERAQKAYERALELMDLSIAAKPREAALKELRLARELFCKSYETKSKSDFDFPNKYYFQFACMVRKDHN